MNPTTKAKLKAAMADAIERSLPPMMTVHFMAAQAGVDQSTVRAYLNRTRGPSPSNPAKKARALAMQEARKRNLWDQGKGQVYAKWWRRLLSRWFPKLRERWNGWIGRWYRSNLKRWARQVRASVHDQEWLAFQKARAKIERKRAQECQASKV